ncbi:MAG: septal ring lytic transglycosylase RlpA family protein [Candidatus Coatesbacteria bacterium]
MRRFVFLAAAAGFLLAGCVAPGGRHGVVAGPRGYVEVGLASWYGMDRGRVKEHGGATASGRPFDQNALTAAHKTLPLGSRVKVTNLENGRTLVVVINDRGPYISGRIIDMTLRGARILGFKEAGTAKVRIEALP